MKIPIPPAKLAEDGDLAGARALLSNARAEFRKKRESEEEAVAQDEKDLAEVEEMVRRFNEE